MQVRPYSKSCMVLMRSKAQCPRTSFRVKSEYSKGRICLEICAIIGLGREMKMWMSFLDQDGNMV
jgi:hypothetical protein